MWGRKQKKKNLSPSLILQEQHHYSAGFTITLVIKNTPEPSSIHPTCSSIHLASLKFCHQCVLTEMPLFRFCRPVKFWSGVESLANLFINSPGYLNIMLCLWESVSHKFLFWKEEGFRGQQNKDSDAGHSLIQGKMFPIGEKPTVPSLPYAAVWDVWLLFINICKCAES